MYSISLNMIEAAIPAIRNKLFSEKTSWFRHLTSLSRHSELFTCLSLLPDHNTLRAEIMTWLFVSPQQWLAKCWECSNYSTSICLSEGTN